MESKKCKLKAYLACISISRHKKGEGCFIRNTKSLVIQVHHYVYPANSRSLQLNNHNKNAGCQLKIVMLTRNTMPIEDNTITELTSCLIESTRISTFQDFRGDRLETVLIPRAEENVVKTFRLSLRPAYVLTTVASTLAIVTSESGKKRDNISWHCETLTVHP